MLKFLFPSAYQLAIVEKNCKDAEDRVKALLEKIDKIEYQNNREEENSRERIYKLAKSREDFENRLTVEYKLKAEDLEAQYTNYKEVFRANVRQETAKDFDELKQELSDARQLASSYKGMNDEIKNANCSMESRLDSYQDIIDSILAKLPNVDLSKINVNLDIEPAEVKVIGGLQGKN